MRPLAVLALMLAAAVSSGCSSYAVAKYGVSVENFTTLKTLGGEKVNVGEFGATKPAQTSIMCRGVGPVKTPDGQPFEQYVRRALIDELKVAEAFSEAASVTLKGNLNRVEFSSTSGNWTFDLTVSSSTGRSVNITDAYEYETSFLGEKACALTAQAFAPAVQRLISKLVRGPDFPGLLR